MQTCKGGKVMKTDKLYKMAIFLLAVLLTMGFAFIDLHASQFKYALHNRTPYRFVGIMKTIRWWMLAPIATFGKDIRIDVPGKNSMSKDLSQNMACMRSIEGYVEVDGGKK